MATQDVLNFDKLLAPIGRAGGGGDSPTGVNPREDSSPVSAYQMLKLARTQARAAERLLAQDDPSAAKPDWRPIMDQCIKLLTEQAKDVEVAAWLIEALVRQRGFAGLRDGYKLVRELAERYWDNLHPMPNEDGMAHRVSSLAGLNGVDADGTLIAPLNSTPLINGGEIPYGRSDYKQAGDLESVTDPDRRRARIERGAVTMEMIQRASSATSAEFFNNLYEDLTQAQEEFVRVTSVLDEKCGTGPDGMPATPPASNIRAVLEDCIDILKSVAGPKLTIAGEADGAIVTTDNGGLAHSGGGGGGMAGDPTRHIRDRNEAFQALLRVAQFFKDTEPHSPVSYALEQAVRWGRMPLPELLGELIPDQSARESVFKLVGIAPPKDSSAS